MLDTLFTSIVMGLISWLIPGIVGGTVTAVVIRWANTAIDFAKLFFIAVGWIVGMVVGGVAGTLLELCFYSLKFVNFDYHVLWMISFAITGMITALIGSWATYKILELAVKTE